MPLSAAVLVKTYTVTEKPTLSFEHNQPFTDNHTLLPETHTSSWIQEEHFVSARAVQLLDETAAGRAGLGNFLDRTVLSLAHFATVNAAAGTRGVNRFTTDNTEGLDCTEPSVRHSATQFDSFPISALSTEFDRIRRFSLWERQGRPFTRHYSTEFGIQSRFRVACDGQLLPLRRMAALAKEVSASKTAVYFTNRQARADFKAFDRIMKRKGGTTPRPGDEMPS